MNTNPQLSSEISPILEYYQDLEKRLKIKGSEDKIRVGETFSSVASVYERIRYTIDYKKEHLLRRNATERILKRVLWEKGESDTRKLAEAVIRELIWARYVKNNYYPTGKITEISAIISKYLRLSTQFEKGWKDWLIGIASCEIEESLDPTVVSFDVFSMAIESWFKRTFDWVEGNLTSQERENQLAIAIHRSLFRSDEPKTAYFLIRRMVPGWNRLTPADIEKRADEIKKALLTIRISLRNPYQAKLYRYVQKEVASFQILKDLIEENPTQVTSILGNPEAFTKKIHEVCEEKYDEIRERVNTGIVRSVVYIFITKIIFAIAIEVPYELYFIKHLSFLPIVSTIFIPLLFVFFVALTIRRPGEENTKKIAETIFDFTYQHTVTRKTEFSLEEKRRGLTYKIFTAAYGVIFVFLFTSVAYILARVGYDVVGIGIFFIFLSLVLLFAYRVKFAASELNVVTIKESLGSNLMASITLPFLDLGVWLADKFSRLNFFILLFDFLVEAPLKNIIGILNEWTTYLKERKQEAIEIPGER